MFIDLTQLNIPRLLLTLFLAPLQSQSCLMRMMKTRKKKRRMRMRKRSWSCCSAWLSCLHLPPSRLQRSHFWLFGLKVDGSPLVTASCLDLETPVWFLVGCPQGTFCGAHQSAWSLTGSLSYLRLGHGKSLWKGLVKKRNKFSAVCPLSSRPLAPFFCLSLLVLLCLSSLAVVTVRTKRKKRSWRMMRRRRKKTCGVGGHLLGADAPLPVLSLVLPPAAWSSHVPFVSLFLGRGSDCSSFAAVERENDGTWKMDSAIKISSLMASK